MGITRDRAQANKIYADGVLDGVNAAREVLLNQLDSIPADLTANVTPGVLASIHILERFHRELAPRVQ